MQALDPGHRYALDSLDGEATNLLQFVKRQGDKYPGNLDHYPGTTMQEVLRALIDRARYVNYQAPCRETEAAIVLMEQVVFLFECRAARVHGRPVRFTIDDAVAGKDKCNRCGHVGCTLHPEDV